MYAADDIGIYDGAPIADVPLPTEKHIDMYTKGIYGRTARDLEDRQWIDRHKEKAQSTYKSDGISFWPDDNIGSEEATAITYKGYKQMYLHINQGQEKITRLQINLEDKGGPLQGELRKWVEERISWYTGSNNVLHLRSWWSILTANSAVLKHTHLYQTNRKTISGVVYFKGDICPLYVKVPGQETDQINNVPGRCILFSAQTEHWTDTYPSDALRIGISFDFCIQDQECCACEHEEICYLCVHWKK